MERRLISDAGDTEVQSALNEMRQAVLVVW
jgi:hypothetical protein